MAEVVSAFPAHQFHQELIVFALVQMLDGPKNQAGAEEEFLFRSGQAGGVPGEIRPVGLFQLYFMSDRGGGYRS